MLLGLSVLFAPLAIGQDVASETTPQRTLTPSDFERFAPRTALDMVRQIPGFSLNDDNDGSRGFGQASGNVLINGQRVSGKSNGTRDALSRITAENVERIEIVDGASLDIPGLSGQVANVFTKTSEGVSGTWRWEGRSREITTPYLDGFEISASGRNGSVEWTMGYERSPGRFGAIGTEDFFDGAGTLLETRQDKFGRRFVSDSVTGSLNWQGSTGSIANLNASYTLFDAEGRDRSLRQPVDGSARIDRLFENGEDEWNTELGGDYEFDLGPGRLKLIGLYRFEHSPFRNRVFAATLDGSVAEQLGGVSATESVFNQTVDETENILRGEFSWAPKDGRDWQIAIEGARNLLESDSDVFRAENFAPLGPDLNTDPTATVEEFRGDFAITHGRVFDEKWTMQASLGVEVSEISQSGAVSASQTFTIPKGFISTSYNTGNGTTLTGRLERVVDQLNFFDFIASADLNNEQDRDANPDLTPEKSWRLEFEAERDFGKWGAGSITLIGEEFEDYVGRFPLADVNDTDGDGDVTEFIGDAIENIDSATRLRAEINGTWLLDPMGLKGVQVETEGYYQDFSLTDPLTGEERRRSNGGIYRWEIDLRHDIPGTDWAWGFNLNQDREEARFTLNQIDDREVTKPFLFAYLEHKDIFGMTGFIELGNLLGTGDETERLVFSPDRTGTVIEREFRDRDFGDFLTFGLSGSF